ncbi:Uncharacterised protein [Elizabethkingia miricola]|nr:Uncharacterised protein [Elizabethkingia miricola]
MMITIRQMNDYLSVLADELQIKTTINTASILL